MATDEVAMIGKYYLADGQPVIGQEYVRSFTEYYQRILKNYVGCITSSSYL